MGRPVEARSIVPVHVDTSKPLQAFAVREGDRNYLQTEETLFYGGFEDTRVKKFLVKGAPPEVSYSLEVGIAPVKWVHDNSKPSLLERASLNLLEDTELILTNDGVVLKYQGEVLFAIAQGITPEVRVDSRPGERVNFEPDKGMFNYNFDLKSKDRGIPNLNIGLGMAYDLKKIQTGYIYKHTFAGDAFYNQVRPGLNAFIIIT